MTYTEAIGLALNGEERGFGYLYQNTYRKQLAITIHKMKNVQEAEDVVQDAYVKAFESLNTLQDPEKFENWIGTIVSHTAINAMRKKSLALFTDFSSEEIDDSFEMQIEDERISSQPELTYTQEETKQLVQELIDTLSEEQRLCILMYHIEGMSIREIAQTLGCTENTVKSRLNYGRKNIKGKAEELQKKGYTLYNLAPLPFFLLLLRNDLGALSSGEVVSAAGKAMADQIFAQLQSGVTKMTSQAAVAGAAAKTGILHTAAGKALVGVLSVGLAGGAIFGGVKIGSAYFGEDNKKAEINVAAVQEAVIDIVDEMSEEGETFEDKEESKKDPKEAALDEYRKIVEHASSETFLNPAEAGGTSFSYRYALEYLNSEDEVPTLFLEANDNMGMYYVRLYQYQPDLDQVNSPRDVIATGVAPDGELHAMMELRADEGIHYLDYARGTGIGKIRKYTLSNDATELVEETVFEGQVVSYTEGPGIETESITWYEITDLSPLQTSTSEDEAETELSEEGRIILTGTVGVYSYQEMVDMIDGIDPNQTYWPSDTSVPLGQPIASELHILD